MKYKLITATMVLLLSVSYIFSGCAAEQEGFAIYLTKDDIPVSQMEALSHIEIADEPFISIDDIVSYDGETHEIELTPEAYERVMGLQVPMTGKSFVVCVDRQTVYWGAFWKMISSQASHGVTIDVTPFLTKANIIRIQLGYPSPSFYQGQDPRAIDVIMRSLEQAGKLK